MGQVSAGLLMYRRRGSRVEFLLVHPGGPFWKNKDAGAWTIPKGGVNAGESELEAAQREFAEETGHRAAGDFIPLSAVKLKSGKTVHAWAFEGDLDPEKIQSNLFKMEWPLKSGRFAEFPEVDRAGFFDLAEGLVKINPAQGAFLSELQRVLEERGT